jgi:pimeloyl-ACP methyl ester carboxylesterase
MHRFLWLVLPLAALPLAGFLYQWIGSVRDRHRFLSLGTLVDIGDGLQLYMSRMGVGGPTVIFESGIAATSQNWLRMQQAVSTCATPVSYDRSGLGWSSSSTSERTPSNTLRELRAMLERAGIQPPYLLVGHSFGGLVVRHFAAQHPDEVVGVILVDAMRTDEWPPVNEARLAHLQRGIQLAGMGIPFARFGLARLAVTSLLCRSGRVSRVYSWVFGNGGTHVLERVTCEVGKMPREVWPIVAAHWSSPRYYRGLKEHLSAVPSTVREMHEAPPIEGIPILLFTPATAEPLSAAELNRIGTNTRQIIAQQSAHWVHLDQHDLVFDAIRNALDEVRAPILSDAELASR